MKYGYIRVSTKEQETKRQYNSMSRIAIDKFYEDKMSGKDISQLPNLKKLLDVVKPNDTIYIDTIDRLGRDTLGVLTILKDMENRGVKLSIVNSPFKIIDFNNHNVMFSISMQVLIADFNRKQMLEVQKRGIAVAKEMGKYKKPKKEKKLKQDEIMELYSKGFNKSHIAKILDVSRIHVINTIKYVESSNKGDN